MSRSLDLLAIGALVWGMSAASLAGNPVAQDATVKAAGDDMAALMSQLSLPPVAATRQVIAALPQVQAARAGVSLALARGQRMEAGTYEWNLKAGTQRRSETSGPQYVEGELAMERSIRWGGKADKDRELGQAGLAVGQSGYADAWHEAVRSMVKAWYDWQRERSTSRLQSQQAALAQEQLTVAMRRVKAGDAPRMDQLMAQAEFDRSVAAHELARGRELVQLGELQKRFPGIVPVAYVDTAVLQSTHLQLPGDPQVWLHRILDDNHEIELAEAEVRVARLQSQRAQLDARPDPLLGVRAARERGGQDTLLGVYVTIPLPGAYREAEQRATLALLDAAEQRLSLTRQRVEAAAQRVVLQATHATSVWQRLASVDLSMASLARLSVKAYGLGEMTLTEALQARRSALESSLVSDTARWDAQEAVSRVLVDSHRLWPAEEDGH